MSIILYSICGIWIIYMYIHTHIIYIYDIFVLFYNHIPHIEYTLHREYIFTQVRNIWPLLTHWPCLFIFAISSKNMTLHYLDCHFLFLQIYIWFVITLHDTYGGFQSHGGYPYINNSVLFALFHGRNQLGISHFMKPPFEHHMNCITPLVYILYIWSVICFIIYICTCVHTYIYIYKYIHIYI